MPGKPPPLPTAADLAHADAHKILEHLRWELKRAMAEKQMKHTSIARAIDYKSSSGAYTDWACERKPGNDKPNTFPPLDKAERLDALLIGFEFVLEGESFASLASKARRRRSTTPAAKHEYDVFIASPMASAAKEGGYRRERSAALELAEAFERHCDFTRFYYAGKDISPEDGFESPSLSITVNAEALRASRYFVLLVTEQLFKPSGVYTEAGMAIAWQKPSVYFVPSDPDNRYLPWMLDNVAGHGSSDLPRIHIEHVKNVKEAIGRIRRHKHYLFNGTK